MNSREAVLILKTRLGTEPDGLVREAMEIVIRKVELDLEQNRRSVANARDAKGDGKGDGMGETLRASSSPTLSSPKLSSADSSLPLRLDSSPATPKTAVQKNRLIATTDDPDHPEVPAPQALPVRKSRATPATWLTPFYEVWQAQHPGSRPAIGPWAKELKPMISLHGEAEVLARWRRMLATTPVRFANAPAFVKDWTSFAQDAVAKPLTMAESFSAIAAKLRLEIAQQDALASGDTGATP